MDSKKLISRLFEQPERYEFNQVLRLLDDPEQPSPDIKTQLCSRWSAQEVISLTKIDETITVLTNMVCLNGPKGILPHYFQDALRQTSIERQNSGLLAFIELMNTRLFRKGFHVNRYSSLATMLEVINQGKVNVSDFFLELNGLGTSPVALRKNLLQYHGRMKPDTCHSVGIDRVLSDYFSLPIIVRRGRLFRQPLQEDVLWQLGYQTGAEIRLGAGMLLGEVSHDDGG